MKTREELITELAAEITAQWGITSRCKQSCMECVGYSSCSLGHAAAGAIDAGYRKQSDTAREILKPLYDCIMEHSDCCVNLSEDIKFNMKKYGVEVEE